MQYEKTIYIYIYIYIIVASRDGRLPNGNSRQSTGTGRVDSQTIISHTKTKQNIHTQHNNKTKNLKPIYTTHQLRLITK